MVVFFFGIVASFILFSLNSCTNKDSFDTPPLKTSESSMKSFMGEPFLEKTVVFSEELEPVREPYLAVAVDGSILIERNVKKHLRRSEDGGKTWGEIIDVPFGFLDSNFIIDEFSGDILSVRLWDNNDRLWRSKDNGKTWKEEKITLKPNEVMKWLNQTGLKTRTTWNDDQENNKYCLLNNASESGISLKYGNSKGRLIVVTSFWPHAIEHPSDRNPIDMAYTCAIYSDDGGHTWQVSNLFPESSTEEAALVELSDGRIYYNSRNHSGFYDESLKRELIQNENLRWEAWSNDGGQSWENLRVNPILPDGGGRGRGYGLKGSLVRLPIKDRDILIFGNTDTGGGAREKMTLWVSFDGGITWPLKRLVHAGSSAYSSLGAGREGTPSEGIVYLLFESSKSIDGATLINEMQVARFNLAWLMDGELTGNGKVPDWTQ